MTRIALDISGMSCAACSARVSRVLARVDGVERAEVNLALERATLDIGPEATPDSLIAAVEKAGYGATVRPDRPLAQRRQDEAREARHRAEERQTLLRFTASAILSATLVIGLLPMMLGTGHSLIGPWTQALLAAGVMAISGARFYREAYAALSGGSANMAVLVSLGTSVAFVFSLWQVIAGNGHRHLYFEAAAVVLTLVMLGKYLEARAKKGASAALQALGRLAPRQAERVEGAGTGIVPVEDLRAGDVVLVRPGAQIPADGSIATGRSAIDEALVTGESLPVEHAEGDAVIAGSVNGDGVLRITVTAIGEDTRLARMVRLVEDAQMSDAPVQRLVDRISAFFVPAVLAVAAAAFLVWWLIGDAETGLFAAVAVLVIACPCALGLATPTALVAGAGAAARAGILIRDIETLEKADAIRAVAFDKTGTLTAGAPKVAAVRAYGVEEAEMLALAAALEAESEHPLAKALVDHARQSGSTPRSARAVSALRGKGLTGTVEGRSVAVGNGRMMAEEGVDADLLDRAAGDLGQGGTVAFVSVDGRLAGAVLFADQARPEAGPALATLTERGLATLMLTGDNEQAARRVAESAGIADYRAGLLPEEKVEAIRKLAADFGGDVAFVGDGLNDAGALAAARLGIALSSGTDAAREAADVTLMRPDLRLVPAALDIARRTRRAIRHNLAWAFVFNLVGIPLAAFGQLSPVFAGAAMAMSSVLVVGNSALLARWKPRFGAGR